MCLIMEFKRPQVARYERLTAAVTKLRAEVTKSVAEPLRIYYRGAITLREVLVKLKERLAPNDAS